MGTVAHRTGVCDTIRRRLLTPIRRVAALAAGVVARAGWQVRVDAVFGRGGRLAASGHPIASDARLSRPPRGFEAAKGTPIADYVCWKSFTSHAGLSDAEMQSSALVERITGFTRTAWPLLEWGWAAADEERPAPLLIRTPMRPLPKPDF